LIFLRNIGTHSGKKTTFELSIFEDLMCDTTIREAIRESAEKNQNQVALSFVHSKGYTYGELYARIVYLGKQLQALGVEKGDKVAVLGPNSPEWGVCYLATLFLGATVVPILNDFSQTEISNILVHSDSKILFISEKSKHKFVDKEYELLKNVLTIEDYSLSKLSQDDVLASFQENDCNIFDLEKTFASLLPEDLAAIIYTSGTTGISKGVMLTHRNILSNIEATSKLQPIKSTDRLLSILPLAHTYECTLGFLMALVNGASIYYLEGLPTASILLPALQKVKPTMMLSVPLVIEKIYKTQILSKFSKGFPGLLYSVSFFRKILNRIIGKKLRETFGGHLHFFGIGGAMLDKKTERFLKEARFPYAIGYGLTETSPLLAGCAPGFTKVGSTGRALQGQELKLININPETKEGELVARGRNNMAGYYKNETLTRQVFTDSGWFRTGDLGFFDKKNRLFIRGRLKDMILGSNGENIYPEEIEAVLTRHRLVAEAIVYELKGKLVAKVHFDYTELEKYIDQLKESAKHFQEDMQFLINNILEEIKIYVNSEVRGFSKVSLILEQPIPFEKTPTLKIKKYLYL
jgi:long-chain acyl-CoA synthetase